MLTISQKMLSFLHEEYSKSHRHYHNLDHIANVLSVLVQYKSKFSNFNAAELAAYFHDIVYNVGDSYEYNEMLSRDKFIEIISDANPHIVYDGNCQDFKTVTLAATMIDCTHGHTLDRIDTTLLTGGEIEDIKMFLDADIKILAEPIKTVIQFEENIRKEFSMYDDETYRKGRVSVLEGFLARPCIFMSEIGKGWENTARKNLRMLIDNIKRG